MAHTWRTTARMMATAAAASAVSRAADSVRRLLEEAKTVEEATLAEPLAPVVPAAPVAAPSPAPSVTQQAPVQPVALGLAQPPAAPQVAATAAVDEPDAIPDLAAAHVATPRPAAHTETPHEFGPVPVRPLAGVGFRNRPRAMAAAPEPRTIPEAPVTVLADPTAGSKKSKIAKQEPGRPKSSKPEGKHRRDHGAISGAVTSSRGRGLRGIEVSAIGADEAVVASAVSGSGGAFIVEDLPAGAYRLRASDPDGDFATAWAGGASFEQARRFKLNDKRTRRKADLSLAAVADIAVKISDRDGSARLQVKITDRSTGLGAGGRVTVSNKLIGVELPLTDGQARVTLHAPDESTKLPKKVEVDYRGDKHTAAAVHTASVR